MNKSTWFRVDPKYPNLGSEDKKKITFADLKNLDFEIEHDFDTIKYEQTGHRVSIATKELCKTLEDEQIVTYILEYSSDDEKLGIYRNENGPVAEIKYLGELKRLLTVFGKL